MTLSINSQFASFGADGAPELVSLHDLKAAAGVTGVEEAVTDNAAAAAAAIADVKEGLAAAIAVARAKIDAIANDVIPMIDGAVASAGDHIVAAQKSADDGILAANTKIDTIAQNLTAADTIQANRSTALEVSLGSARDFTLKGAFFSTDSWQGSNAPLPDKLFTADGLGGFHYLNATSAGNYSVSVRAPLPFAGKVYRYQAMIRAIGTDGTYSPDYELSPNQLAAQTGSYAGFAALPVSAGWMTIDYVIDGTTSTYAWLNPHLRGSIGIGGQIEIAYFRCFDITTAQAVVAVNARIGTEETTRLNSDNALSQRIDSVAAAGGYDDTNVYAEIRSVDQAAIDRDSATGKRVDSVITDYKAADVAANGRIDQTALTASNAVQAVADLSTSVNSRFSGVNTTLSGYDGRITALSTSVQGYVSRTGTLETTVGPADGSKPPLMARVSSAENALANFSTNYAAASRATALEAQVNGTAGSNLLTRASDQATVIANGAAGAVAQTVSTLSARILNTGANLLPNSSGENGGVNTAAQYQWAGFGGPWISGVSPFWGQRMENDAPTGNVIEIDSPRVACAPNAKYTASADLLLFSNLSNPLCYVDICFVRNDGSIYYANNGRGIYGERDFGSPGFRDASWSTAQSPADATQVFMRAVFASDQAGSHRVVGIRQAKLEVGAGPCTPYSKEGTDQQTSATLTQQAGVLVGLNNRSSVYWSVTGTTSDGSTMIQLSKADGSAGLFYVNANMLIDGNLLVNGTINTVKIGPNAITSTASAFGFSQTNITAQGDGETPRLSYTSSGGVLKIDVQSDGNRTGGSGVMTVQLFASYNGSETALSRQVAFSPTNTAVPVSFWQIANYPAGAQIQFFLRYYVTAANTSWSYSSGAICVTELKR